MLSIRSSLLFDAILEIDSPDHFLEIVGKFWKTFLELHHGQKISGKCLLTKFVRKISLPMIFGNFSESSKIYRKGQEINSFLTIFKQILEFPNILGIVFVNFSDILGRFLDCQCN